MYFIIYNWASTFVEQWIFLSLFDIVLNNHLHKKKNISACNFCNFRNLYLRSWDDFETILK
jgi:hypothetical protein